MVVMHTYVDEDQGLFLWLQTARVRGDRDSRKGVGTLFAYIGVPLLWGAAEGCLVSRVRRMPLAPAL